MLRQLLLLVATVVLAAALVLPASAADYLITDLAEDANGINSQGLSAIMGLAGQSPPEDTATPAGARQYDLLGVRYVTMTETVEVDGESVEKIVGVESRLAMTLDPNTGPLPGIVRLEQTINGCNMSFQYYGGTNGSTPGGTGNIRVTCDGDTTSGYPMITQSDAALDLTWDETAGELVWTYNLGTGAAADGHFVDFLGTPATITPGASHTRFNSGVITAPVFDEMLNPDGLSFTIGEDVPGATT